MDIEAPKDGKELASRWHFVAQLMEDEKDMHFNMQNWVLFLDKQKNTGILREPQEAEHPCGTVGCIAGFGALACLRDVKVGHDSELTERQWLESAAFFSECSRFAQEYLCLTNNAANELFTENIGVMAHKDIAAGVVRKIGDRILADYEHVIDRVEVEYKHVIEAKKTIFADRLFDTLGEPTTSELIDYVVEKTDGED